MTIFPGPSVCGTRATPRSLDALAGRLHQPLSGDPGGRIEAHTGVRYVVFAIDVGVLESGCVRSAAGVLTVIAGDPQIDQANG
jgi:hypothetical protein